MEAGYYSISTVGAALLPGVSRAVEVQLMGVAKTDAVEHYTLVNEYTAGRLAQALGLPVPPGTIAFTNNGEKMWVSLRFTAGPSSLPPVDPMELAADHPNLAAGIVAFDCWVGNWDRHAGNIAYVREVSGVSIFDHGRCLLRLPSGEGEASIASAMDDPLVHPSHALLQHIVDRGRLQRWAERIRSIAPELIEDVCRTAERLDVCSSTEASALQCFLKHRQGRIMQYLTAAGASLPNVPDWSVVP